jgi:hypothetical protein
MGMPRPGTVVRSWNRVLTIYDDSKLQFIGQGAIDLIRHGDIIIGEISVDELVFEMKVVSDPIVTDTRESAYSFILQPTDREAFWQMIYGLEMDFQTLAQRVVIGHILAYEARNVVVIPRHAIHPEDGREWVHLYEDGQLKKRYIVTGLTHEGRTQVISGLDPGQMVVLDIR